MSIAENNIIIILQIIVMAVQKTNNVKAQAKEVESSTPVCVVIIYYRYSNYS